jgi:hypothetical protein
MTILIFHLTLNMRKMKFAEYIFNSSLSKIWMRSVGLCFKFLAQNSTIFYRRIIVCNRTAYRRVTVIRLVNNSTERNVILPCSCCVKVTTQLLQHFAYIIFHSFIPPRADFKWNLNSIWSSRLQTREEPLLVKQPFHSLKQMLTAEHSYCCSSYRFNLELLHLSSLTNLTQLSLSGSRLELHDSPPSAIRFSRYGSSIAP